MMLILSSKLYSIFAQKLLKRIVPAFNIYCHSSSKIGMVRYDLLAICLSEDLIEVFPSCQLGQLSGVQRVSHPVRVKMKSTRHK